MRILHVDCGKEMRGGQYQVLHLLKGLAADGHELRFVGRAGSPVSRLVAELGVAVESGFRGVMRNSSWADCVHAHDARAHTLCMAVLKPLVVSRRVIFPVNESAVSRWKYSRPLLFLAVSRAVGNVLEQAKVPRGKVRIVYDGVPVPLELKEPDLEEWLNERSIIVAPATTDSKKGSDLVAAASAVAGLSVSFSANLPVDLQGARCFVYISRSEGLGSAALLASAAGVPVIASDTGGLPEVVRDRETGLLTSNNPGAIAEAMRFLADNPERAFQMGRRGRNLIQREFTVTRMVERTTSAYREVVEA